jgi:hypothetical protein
MGNKGFRLLQGLSSFLPGMVTKVQGSITALFLKEQAKGPDALEPHVDTDLRYGQVLAGQPLPGLFDPALRQILVRGLPMFVWGEGSSAKNNPSPQTVNIGPVGQQTSGLFSG